MEWKKLLLFGFALIGLFLLTGTASAETFTVTTYSSIYAHLDDQGYDPDIYVGVVPEIWHVNGDFLGLGPGDYAFIYVQATHTTTNYTPVLVIDYILDDGAQVGAGMGPYTIIDVPNGRIFVYSIETAPDWANGASVVSYKFNAVELTITDVSNNSYDRTISYSETYKTIITVDSVVARDYMNVTTPFFAYLIPVYNPAGSVTVNGTKLVSTAPYLPVDGKNMVFPYFYVAADSFSMTGAAVLAVENHNATITIDAYDALEPTKAVTPTVIIDSETYNKQIILKTGVYTLTVTADGYDAETLVISATDTTTYSTLISMFPETAIFSVSHFSVVRGYEGGLISDVIVISPRSSFTNNVTMQFINFPFTVTAVVDGTTSVVSGNNLLLGAVNGEKVVTIIMSANATTQAQAYIKIIANDAFTGTASMSFAEFIAVLPVPFSMTTPAVWVLGENMVRIANDTNTMTITFAVKNAGGTEIYNKIVTLTPLQIYTFSPVLEEGQNSVYINFTYLSDAGLFTGTESGSIFFLAEAHRQAEIDYSVLTVTYNVVNTATVKVTNPFGMVGTYTVFFVGNWGTETASKVVAILPNSTATVGVYFDGPTDEEISAYEATIWVVYNNATVFSTTVPVTATTNPGFFGTGISQNDIIYIVIGLVAVALLVIAIRRGDEL